MNVASPAVRFPPAAVPGRAVTDRASRLPARIAGPAGVGTVAGLAGAGPAPVTRVLAVIARPGQEAVDLGALLHAFRRAGASLALLCLTRGEASALNSTCERLKIIRPWELHVAAAMLRVSSVMVADFPDGGLSRLPVQVLTERVERALREHAPDLLLVPDPAGSPDDARAGQAACLAAEPAGVPVAARVRPGRRGGWALDLGADAPAARAIQRAAAAAHASQSGHLAQLQRELDALGRQEQLRWLIAPPSGAEGQIR